MGLFSLFGRRKSEGPSLKEGVASAPKPAKLAEDAYSDLPNLSDMTAGHDLAPLPELRASSNLATSLFNPNTDFDTIKPIRGNTDMAASIPKSFEQPAPTPRAEAPRPKQDAPEVLHELPRPDAAGKRIPEEILTKREGKPGDEKKAIFRGAIGAINIPRRGKGEGLKLISPMPKEPEGVGPTAPLYRAVREGDNLFLDMEGFKSLRQVMDQMTVNFDSIRQMFNRMSENREDAGRVYEKWRKCLVGIERRLAFIDKAVFSHGGGGR